VPIPIKHHLAVALRAAKRRADLLSSDMSGAHSVLLNKRFEGCRREVRGIQHALAPRGAKRKAPALSGWNSRGLVLRSRCGQPESRQEYAYTRGIRKESKDRARSSSIILPTYLREAALDVPKGNIPRRM
jgi:hypothetical protein